MFYKIYTPEGYEVEKININDNEVSYIKNDGSLKNIKGENILYSIDTDYELPIILGKPYSLKSNKKSLEKYKPLLDLLLLKSEDIIVKLRYVVINYNLYIEKTFRIVGKDYLPLYEMFKIYNKYLKENLDNETLKSKLLIDFLFLKDLRTPVYSPIKSSADFETDLKFEDDYLLDIEEDFLYGKSYPNSKSEYRDDVILYELLDDSIVLYDKIDKKVEIPLDFECSVLNLVNLSGLKSLSNLVNAYPQLHGYKVYFDLNSKTFNIVFYDSDLNILGTHNDFVFTMAYNILKNSTK